MCLAIVKNAGIDICLQYLRNGFNSNSHGAGIGYAENGKIVIKKGFFKFDDFYTEYEKVKEKQLLIHFRQATSGEKNEFNCHPWEVETKDGHWAVIHNGVIGIQSSKEMSDTGHFVNYVLKPILERDSDFCWTMAGKFLIELAIGSYNKICILDNKGKIIILNEENGEWVDGVWYSNTGYKFDTTSQVQKYFGLGLNNFSHDNPIFNSLMDEQDIPYWSWKKQNQTIVEQKKSQKETRYFNENEIQEYIGYGFSIKEVEELLD